MERGRSSRRRTCREGVDVRVEGAFHPSFLGWPPEAATVVATARQVYNSRQRKYDLTAGNYYISIVHLLRSRSQNQQTSSPML